MGFKLSLIFGLLLIGSAVYIKSLHTQLGTLKGNQVILEGKIEEQNASIDTYLAEQQELYIAIDEIEKQKNEAIKEVNEVRNKFARHDLNSLALAKPKMLEKRVNAASKKILQSLSDITDPQQFMKKIPLSKEVEVKK
tara:strand:+ start:715 stop:1128 length:414 start_codon:yes stop_codon:yes gene_type:complete